jgi:hypothetical protein
MKNTKSSKSSKTISTANTPAPAPATTPVNSTAEQAPAPQTTQAPNAVAATPAITNVANASNNGTKVALQTSYVALIAGLQALYQPSDILQLSTGDQTRDELIAEFQQFVQAAEDTKASYKAWRGDVQSERAVLAEVSPKRAAIRTTMEGRYGKGSTQLMQLGFTPRKPSTKTVQAKAAGVVKGKATRAARGTRGSKQKLAITGNVTGVVITPITSTENVAAPANEPAPAATAAAPATASPAVKPAGQ